MSDSHVTNLPDLDDRLQAAYAAMGPSADTRNRVLASLQAEEKAVGHRRLRRPHWHIVVPLALAACLALAMVVMLPTNMSPTTRQSKQDAQSETMSFKNAAPVTDIAPEGIDEEQSPMAQDADSVAGSVAAEVDSAEEAPAPTWTVVELDDGRRFEVGNPSNENVDGQKAKKATAYGLGESGQTSCEVVDERYVRFPHNDVWYALSPLHS